MLSLDELARRNTSVPYGNTIPKYFWLKATMVIPYACRLTSVDVWKYQHPPP
jgi:hypothetical protein